jgi:hypothetical protein
MSMELLFGLALLLFLVAWGLWLLAISAGSRPGMIVGPVLVIALAAAVVVINGERGEEEREDYRIAIESLIDAVAEAQEAAYEADGAYTEDVPELRDRELTSYDTGLLVDTKDIDTTLVVEEDSYTVSGALEDELYTLEVERSADGGVEETRTCVAAPEGGCVDGTW